MKRNLAPVRTLVRELIPVVGSFAPGAGSLAYDAQSGSFTAGLVLTGGTSGATATILQDTDGGTTGTLLLTDIVGGPFADNEAITDSSTGAATANGASSSEAITAKKGIGWSVVRTSTGLYTVTLTDGGVDLISVKAMLQLVTADDKYAQAGLVTNLLAGAAPTFEIRVLDISAAAVADLVPDANTRIHFVAWVRSSAVKPTRG